MEEVTAAVVAEAFPHGVAVFYNEFRPVFDVVGLSVFKDGDQVVVVGYAYPNKDFLFDLSNPKESDHGWWVKTLDGERCFWTPLSAEREAIALDRMEDV